MVSADFCKTEYDIENFAKHETMRNREININFVSS